ncbi:MAG: DUF1257 domain-containing protein [Acidobacteria bacterium]|nr:DUF1257 domain-containing protein [Acidobacteriota bacterium]
MSQFTTLKTRFTRLDFLKKALNDLGLAWEEGDLMVRGFMGKTTPAQIRVSTRDPNYPIGFRRVGDTYEMVADWYYVKEHTPESLLKALSRRYAYHAALATLGAQNFSLVEEEVGPEEQVHLVLRRMVN